MTKQHTPGPWFVKQWNDNEADICGFSVADADGYSLPTSDFDGDVAEAEANARLIAAAPDLLEALLRVTNLLDICGFGVDSKDAVKAATSAIAKATNKG